MQMNASSCIIIIITNCTIYDVAASALPAVFPASIKSKHMFDVVTVPMQIMEALTVVEARLEVNSASLHPAVLVHLTSAATGQRLAAILMLGAQQ